VGDYPFANCAAAEGLILACSIMIISGVYGPQVWQTPIAQLVPIPTSLDIVADATVRDLWWGILLVSFFVAHLPECVINVVRARRARGEAVLPVFLDWFPMIVYTAATVAWMSSPYSILLRDNHLVLFCVTQSFVFGRMTTKIILAHLTRQAFPYWTVLMAPLVSGAVMVNLPRFGGPRISARFELLYLWGYFVFATVVYFRWAALVITAICDFLGINCLTIPAEKRAANRAELEKQGKTS